jgi:predicted AAA+ superfamily ATPase
MEILLEQSARLLNYTSLDFKRYLHTDINWKERLIGIKGARGVGKTTLLLQHLKELALPASKAAYFAMDDLYFSGHSLKETSDIFYKKGGRVLALDEVHKYPGWSGEIKNLYDFYPDLQIFFTGSSIIDITKESGDLSRRALLYDLPGLSFREYLIMKGIANFKPLPLKEVLFHPASYSELPGDEFSPLEHFTDYLKQGYYPFGVQHPETLYQRINQVVRTSVEIDMAELPTFDIRNAKKMLQLVEVIAGQVPFKPNIKELGEKTQIHRNSINAYLHYLEQAKIIALLYPAGRSTATLQKPEKIFLQNTTLLYALAKESSDPGSVRETFFHSMVSPRHKLEAPKKGDFFVDNEYTMEIGGRTKKKQQIISTPDAWVVKDGIETGSHETIPLWAFGFLY